MTVRKRIRKSAYESPLNQAEKCLGRLPSLILNLEVINAQSPSFNLGKSGSGFKPTWSPTNGPCRIHRVGSLAWWSEECKWPQGPEKGVGRLLGQEQWQTIREVLSSSLVENDIVLPCTTEGVTRYVISYSSSTNYATCH